MRTTQRDRLLDSIADADPTGPTDPFHVKQDRDAEAGVHSDLTKLTNPDAYLGAVEEGEGPTLLPLDLNED